MKMFFIEHICHEKKSCGGYFWNFYLGAKQIEEKLCTKYRKMSWWSIILACLCLSGSDGLWSFYLGKN